MMKVIAKTEVTALAPLWKALVAQENARGDSLNAELLHQDLLEGNQFALAFGATAEKPLLVLVCQQVVDRLRGLHVLWVHNFFLADGPEFALRDWADEARLFDAMTKQYAKVCFQTDNPALLAFLGKLGYFAKATAIVCELTKTPGEGLTALAAASKLEA